MAAKAILLVALAALLLIGIIRADDIQIYPGSDVKTEDAVNQSDAIFVGVITDMGVNAENSLNYMHDGEVWDHMKVDVIKVLRGAIGKQISITTFCSGIDHVKKIPLRGSRKLVLGSQYLFFAKKSGDKDEPIRLVKESDLGGAIDPLETIKLLPATDDNIAKVKKLIGH